MPITWLWLGTTTGLYRGHAGDVEWQRFAGVTGALQNDWVTALAVHGGKLYVGTYSGGIVRLVGTAATQVAPGWVNPGGLTLVGDRLYAATQDGLRASDDGIATGATSPRCRARTPRRSRGSGRRSSSVRGAALPSSARSRSGGPRSAATGD